MSESGTQEWNLMGWDNWTRTGRATRTKPVGNFSHVIMLRNTSNGVTVT